LEFIYILCLYFQETEIHTYRQLIRWCWHLLGKEVRVVIPACIVRKIRDAFPDINEDYPGFHQAVSDWSDSASFVLQWPLKVFRVGCRVVRVYPPLFMCDTSAKLITVFIRVFTYSEIFKCFDNLLYNILKTLYLEEDCYCSKSYYNFQSMSIVIFMLIQLECALKKNWNPKTKYWKPGLGCTNRT
jgi:hypothetical protein